MRLPDSEHTSRPWRIHEFTQDFRVEDVWALPASGGWDDFPRLVAQLAGANPSRGSSRLSRALWAVRWKIGRTLGWDGPDAGPGSRVPPLGERLPVDLRGVPGPDFARLPFTSLYLLGDEFAAEIANRTVHAVMHVGWIPDERGVYSGQLAVLVKPNGRLGACYLAAIRPLRNLIVYPRIMRDVGQRWRDNAAERSATPGRETAAARDAHEPHTGPAGPARQIAVPAAARALSTLSRIDYEDAFLVRAGPGRDRTGEQWAREVLEGAPPRVRDSLLRVWRLLGLKLGPPRSRRYILGWPVLRSTPDYVLLAARSRVGLPAQLLFKRERQGLLFATFVQQRNPLVRMVWSRVVPAHQRTVSFLLRRAARRED
jgi:Protein of unknown function (DUF2867)